MNAKLSVYSLSNEVGNLLIEVLTKNPHFQEVYLSLIVTQSSNSVYEREWFRLICRKCKAYLLVSREIEDRISTTVPLSD